MTLPSIVVTLKDGSLRYYTRDGQIVTPKERTLGDVEGHEFHGNQWTEGQFDEGEYVGPADQHPRVKKEFDKARALNKAAKVALRKVDVAFDRHFETSEFRRAMDVFELARKNANEAERRAKDVLFDEMSKGNVHGPLFVADLDTTFDDRIREDITRALEDIGRIDKSGIVLPPLKISNSGESGMLGAAGEAFPGGSINLANGINVSYDTAVHEIGHQYEFVSSSLMKAAQALQDSRVQGGVPEYVTSSKKRFPNPYSAVRYRQGFTEVISTGLESFMRSPFHFQEQDPEHFRLIVNMLEGRYAR